MISMMMFLMSLFVGKQIQQRPIDAVHHDTYSVAALADGMAYYGRIERTLFMIDWILDAGLQRQAQIGLNKGEAHHALKRAISFHRRGEIRDRSGEGQHYRIAGMNLLAAIIIFWNTMKLGEVVDRRAVDGIIIPPDLLAHVSPLGWEHINLTGEYRWPKSLA